MENNRIRFIRHVDQLIMLFVFALYFAFPVIFTRIEGAISWPHVFKIWEDHLLLLPLFAINHWFLVPKILLRRRYTSYTLAVLGMITLFTTAYYYRDEILNKKPADAPQAGKQRPAPVPPYANLLISSLLVAGVDTGLLLSKKWQENEVMKHLLEQQNTKLQLDVLRNQISPHFFMNTLNNIYALISLDAPMAKNAVMKLSKLMRYMLYENERGKVKLSKEFEFIQSYIDLMKLRYTDDLSVRLTLPEQYDDMDIPPMLFISYIENAFKHGASYQKNSYVHIDFDIRQGRLHFICTNTKPDRPASAETGGLGLQNSKNRLDLIYGRLYSLAMDDDEDLFTIELEIPIS